MKKIFILIFMLSVCFLHGQEPGGNKQNQKKSTNGNKYQNEADSLRKEHLAPRRADSVEKSQTDKMPALKPDTNKNPNMPTNHPKPNQHMPVKELSDTLKK